MARERGTAMSSGLQPSLASILSMRWVLVVNWVFICSLSPLLVQRYINMPNISFIAGFGSGPVEDPAERLLNVVWSFWISMPGPGVA